MSVAHFSIEQLIALRDDAVAAALVLPEFAARASLARRTCERSALFACMVEQSLPIPLDLLGIRSLLIVDDEPPVLRSMVRLLRQAAPELNITLAESASDGIAHAEVELPDAILLDAYMPATNGVQVCSRILGTPATSHIPILAMTADPTPELASAFERAGAVAFLEKPVVVARLFEILSTHLLPSAAGDS